MKIKLYSYPMRKMNDKIVAKCKKSKTDELCLTICKSYEECHGEIYPTENWKELGIKVRKDAKLLFRDVE